MPVSNWAIIWLWRTENQFDLSAVIWSDDVNLHARDASKCSLAAKLIHFYVCLIISNLEPSGRIDHEMMVSLMSWNAGIERV